MELNALHSSMLLGGALIGAALKLSRGRLRGRGRDQPRLSRVLKYTLVLCMLIWLLNEAAEKSNVEPLRGGRTAKNDSGRKYQVRCQGLVRNVTLDQISAVLPSPVVIEDGETGKQSSLSIPELATRFREEEQPQKTFFVLNARYGKVDLMKEVSNFERMRDLLEKLEIVDGGPIRRATPDGRDLLIRKGGGVQEVSASFGRRLANFAYMMKNGFFVYPPDNPMTRMTLKDLLRLCGRYTVYLKNPPDGSDAGWRTLTPSLVEQLEQSNPVIFFPTIGKAVPATRDIIDNLRRDPDYIPEKETLKELLGRFASLVFHFLLFRVPNPS